MHRFAVFVVLFSLFGSAHAQVTVKEAWVRATVPQQKVTGAFFHVTSAADARLVDARSPIAGTVEMHETRLEGDMMRMRPVAAIALPAGKAVAFKPGGYHLMLMALKRPIREGESVPLTLVVEGKDGQRRNVEVNAAVRPLTAHGGGNQGH
jgi:copper(I)-binding protein